MKKLAIDESKLLEDNEKYNYWRRENSKDIIRGNDTDNIEQQKIMKLSDSKPPKKLNRGNNNQLQQISCIRREDTCRRQDIYSGRIIMQ